MDVWGLDGELFIGHDKPYLSVMPKEFINNSGVWAHAKNIEALKILSGNCQCKLFTHDREPIAIVEGGFFWTTNPDNVCQKTIFMDVEGVRYSPREIVNILTAHGICSDRLDPWRALCKMK